MQNGYNNKLIFDSLFLIIIIEIDISIPLIFPVYKIIKRKEKKTVQCFCSGIKKEITELRLQRNPRTLHSNRMNIYY